MLVWLVTVATAVYPAQKTSQCLHKPVRGGVRHWCIFWFLFSALNIIEPIGSSLIPFWQFVKALAIVINYSPNTTEITFKSMRGLYEHINTKLKRNAQLQQGLIRFHEKYFIPTIDFLEQDMGPNLPSFLTPILGGLLYSLKSCFPKVTVAKVTPLVPGVSSKPLRVPHPPLRTRVSLTEPCGDTTFFH